MTEGLKQLKITSPDKLSAVQEVANYFLGLGFKIVDMDLHRPWGFYFYFDPAQSDKFSEHFFGSTELKDIDSSLPLQPKVLVFEPGKMVSWQYHHRRSEIWRCITAECQIIMSETDKLMAPKNISFGEVVSFKQGIRHRGGASLGQWSAVAEIWQHTDPTNPSDENDIVRLQDDFNRK